MSIRYCIGKTALNITFKTPLVSLVLAFITISLLYIVASGTQVGIYRSLEGEVKFSDGNAVIEAIVTGQTADSNISDSLFYEKSDGARYSCTYTGKEKISDSYKLKFAVNDIKYPINTRKAHRVNIDIKTGSISLLEKLLFNRGK